MFFGRDFTLREGSNWIKVMTFNTRDKTPWITDIRNRNELEISNSRSKLILSFFGKRPVVGKHFCSLLSSYFVGSFIFFSIESILALK